MKTTLKIIPDPVKIPIFSITRWTPSKWEARIRQVPRIAVLAEKSGDHIAKKAFPVSHLSL